MTAYEYHTTLSIRRPDGTIAMVTRSEAAGELIELVDLRTGRRCVGHVVGQDDLVTIVRPHPTLEAA